MNPEVAVQRTRYEKALNLKDKDFKQIIGVTKETYEAMLLLLRCSYAVKHKEGGRPSKLSLEDQLFMTLKYLRWDLTPKELAFEFDIDEATAHDTIMWVENTLVKSDEFSLPGKKTHCEDADIEIILVDVIEKSN